MKILVALCGLPGSGKTSIAKFVQKHYTKSIFTRKPIPIVSRYKYLKERHNRELAHEPALPPQYWEDQFYNEVSKQLKKRDIVLLDGSFVTTNKRKRIVDFADRYGDEVVPILIYCYCIDHKELIRRLSNQVATRTKLLQNTDPISLVNEYAAKFEEVKMEEGFGCIIKIDTLNHVSQISYYKPRFKTAIEEMAALFEKNYIDWRSDNFKP